MARKGTYNGGGTVVTVYPSSAGTKAKRSKLGALQIAAREFAANPPPMFPLFPPDADANRLKPPTKKRKKPRVPKGARILK